MVGVPREILKCIHKRFEIFKYLESLKYPSQERKMLQIYIYISSSGLYTLPGYGFLRICNLIYGSLVEETLGDNELYKVISLACICVISKVKHCADYEIIAFLLKLIQ